MTSRLNQSHLPLFAVAALAAVTAGNTIYSAHAEWRTLRSIILWGTCVSIVAARAGLGRKLHDLTFGDERVRLPLGDWRSGERTARAIGAGLLLLVVLGEILPAGHGRALTHLRLIVLAPTCVVLLYDWHRARRLFLANATPRGGEVVKTRGALVLESVLFGGIWIAACALAVLAIANALWGGREHWVTMRPLVTCALLFAILWQMQRRVGGALSQLQSAAQDERAQIHHGSRNWAVEHDSARDRAPSTAAILDALDLRPGMRVADVGTGGGYFAMKMAQRVGPGGTVIATDVSAPYVARLRERAERNGLDCLQVRLVSPEHPLPSLLPHDRVLLANVYLFRLADERQGRAWLGQLVDALRPGGKLVLYNEFVHEAGWVESPDWPPLECSQPDARTLIEWAAPSCDLVAEIPLPTPPRLAPHEKPGYLIVLQNRARRHI